MNHIIRQLTDETKLYLLFLNSILPTINSFSTAFQVTNYTTIHLLHSEMRKLTKRLLRCFVKVRLIQTKEVTEIVFDDRKNQLDSHDLEIGNDARILALQLDEEGFTHEVNEFHKHVRSFFVKFIKVILKKFPFESTILSDLRILNPSERCNFSDLPGAAVRLAKELPQLKLTEKLDELKVEAIDYQLADSEDLPSSINAIDQFWSDMRRIGSITSVYENLLTLVRALLSIPASNADS